MKGETGEILRALEK